MRILDGLNLWEKTKSDVIHKGLFDLSEGQNSGRLLIIERFPGSWVGFKTVEKSPIDEHVLGSLTESIGDGVLMVLEGRFQMADTRNANNRIYPNPIWETVLENASKWMRRIKSGEMLGELDHPRDGETLLQRVASMVTDLRRNPQNEKEIIGRMAVFGTPNGHKIKAIHDGKGRFGVSSRGSGSVVRVEGSDVVQNDFDLDTWDVVHNPSTPGAYPEVRLSETQRPSEALLCENDKEQDMGPSRLERILERYKSRDLQTLSVDALQLIKEDLEEAKKELCEAASQGPQASAAATEAVLFINKVEEALTVAETSREVVAEVKEKVEKGPLPRPTTKDGVLEALTSYTCEATSLAEVTKTVQSHYRGLVEAEGALRLHELDAIGEKVGSLMEAQEQDETPEGDVFTEAAKHFQPLLEAQTAKAVAAIAEAQHAKASQSEMSAQMAATKQVLNGMLVEARKIKDRCQSLIEGNEALEEELQGAAKLIDNLTEAMTLERLRGAIEGIAATHRDLSQLPNRICKARTLREAVSITNTLVAESLPPVDDRDLTEREQIVGEALEESRQAERLLMAERAEPPKSSLTPSVPQGILETTERALTRMRQLGAGR